MARVSRSRRARAVASSSVKAKKGCCKSRPRCKRCPVVLKRLEREGFAKREGKRRYTISPELDKRTLKRARRRA
jgi:hypothetical protein